MSALEEQLKQMRESVLNDINKGKDIVFEGLVQNAIINNIPESLFANYFLPQFVNQFFPSLLKVPQTSNPNLMVEWISIAGTPTAEVGIFRDGTNILLFKVPPILATSSLFLNDQNKPDLGSIFTRYEMINNNIPSTGLKFLVSALNSKNAELMSNLNVDSDKTTWLYILQRYGYINIDSVQENITESTGDFFEY